MPWFKVDDGFHGHPKVMDLSVAAVGIWALAGSWCAKYLTDGHVTTRALHRLGGTPELASELVDAGLWLVADGGFQFKDWEDYQPLKDDVEAEREAARERMRNVRAKSKGVRASDTRTVDERAEDVRPNTDRTSEEVRLAPSLPFPVPIPVPSQDDSGRKKPETRLPNDWAPTASHFERARANRLDIAREVEAFKLHAETHDRHAANWNAAFTTWLTKAKPTQKGGDRDWALRM